MLLPEFSDDSDLAHLPTAEEELGVTIRALALLKHALSRILRACEETGKETLYIWDWEMVHEAINPYSASSVFSGVLWMGLEALEGRSHAREGQVIYAEGTKRELLWYLSRQVDEYQRRSRSTVGSVELMLGSDTTLNSTPFSSRPDWKDVLANVGRLMRLDESIDRLVFILERYATPMPMEPATVSASRITHYQHRLRRVRRDEDRRVNEADAWNLASSDALVQRDASPVDVGLVTATRAVKRVNWGITRDPFYFALDMQLRREYPDMKHRCIALDEMLARLHQLSAKTRSLHVMAGLKHDKAELRRGEASELFEALKSSLRDDPILNHISDSLIRSAEVLNNSRVQAAQSTRNLDVSSGGFSGLSQFERKIYRALGELGVERPTSTDLNLSWIDQWKEEDIQRLELKSSTTRVMEAEITPESIAVSWEAGVTLAGFLRYVESTWLPGLAEEATAKLIAVQNNQPVSTTFVLRDPLDLFRQVAAAGKNRIMMVRVTLSTANLWYDSSQQLTKKDLAVRVNEPKVAISWDRQWNNSNAAAQLYNETSRQWVFPSAIEDAVAALTEWGANEYL